MKKKTIIILVSIVVPVILAVLGLLVFLGNKTSNPQSIRIYIPEGTSQTALIDTLHVRGILDEGLDTKIFNLQISLLNASIRPGAYDIEAGMKTLDLARRFKNGRQAPIRLTIGKFRLPQQLNDFLNNKLMHDDFNIPLDSFYYIRPNTYEVYWTITPEQFLQRMKKEFLRKEVDLETIILASIVEEETNNNEEKPLIASVYLNRLKKNMPLQADPTVKYAIGDFSLKRILNKHLTVESPFNTYLHTGLPPAPICLPSDASVEAVLNAPETNFLYFCASDKLDGTHRFATTLDEHNRNAAAFHRVLNARGIK